MTTRFKAPEIEGLIFWSIYTSDSQNRKLAIFPDDELACEMVRQEVAQRFNINTEDVVIKSIYHNFHNREVIGAYLKSGHKGKVVGKIESIQLQLEVLKGLSNFNVNDDNPEFD